MAMTQDQVVVGVFPQASQAREAVDALRRAGYRDDEIGFLARAGVDETGAEQATSVTTGVVSGGVIGGILGAAGALLIPGIGPAVAGGILVATLGAAGAGALVGGIVATLTGLGVSEQQARYYQRELEEGRTIVIVKPISDHEDALTILRQHGALNAKTEEANVNKRPPSRGEETGTPPPVREDEPGGRTLDEPRILPPDDSSVQ